MVLLDIPAEPMQILTLLMRFLVTFGVFLYIIGPFIVMQKVKFQLHPDIDTFEPESAKYPLVARNHFEDSQTQLEELGFHPIAWMLLPNMMPNTSTIAIMFHKPSHSEYAMANIIFTENSTVGMQTMSYVEFQTEFTSGVEVAVLNPKKIGTFKTPEHIEKYQFPGNRDLKFLYSVFEKIADKTGNFRHRVDALTAQYQGDPVEMLRHGMQKELNREVERGWMYVNQAAGQYRLRIFGAFRAAWLELFPLKQIRLAANRKRNRQLLDELGISDAD